MQQLSYPSSAVAFTPEQQGFQALAPAAAGAPPPTYLPGQAYQQTYGYASGYPSQGSLAMTPMQQQFGQYNPGYTMQQQSQSYNPGYPMQPQYTQYPGPQYPQQYPQQHPQQYSSGQPYSQQMPYPAPMYNLQAPAYQQPSAPGFSYPGAGYSQGSQGKPNSSSGFNMQSGLMGLAAGAVGGALIDHMVSGHHNNHNSHNNGHNSHNSHHGHHH